MSDDDLRLADFRPRSMLRVPVHEVPRPRYRAIDVHNHLGAPFGGEWATRDPADLIDTLDEAGVELVVDLDGGHGDALAREIDRWQRRWPERVAVFAGLDYDSWSSDESFGASEARRLRESVDRGARGLKVWKLLGLRARDKDGRIVAVDDVRLDPLWSAAAELSVPILIHVADPIAFFEPLDPTNERWEELHENPDWHFWPKRQAGDPDAPGFPGFNELLSGLDRLVGRHRRTTFIGAHVASAAEDLALVGGLLDRRPNLSVDIAARLAELGRQPYSTRAFFLRYADRILFGVDMAPDPALYAIHYRFLETYDESFDYSTDPIPGQGRWQIHGIGLPDDVLRKVYRDNALRILKSTSAPEPSGSSAR